MQDERKPHWLTDRVGPWLQSAPLSLFLFLLAFRIVNALSISTFFQPDEYFQALEPAWHLAFDKVDDKATGAWLTWEWKAQLRSSLPAILFAGVYKFADLLAHVLRLSDLQRDKLLLVAPKLIQALFAAATDYYTAVLAKWFICNEADLSSLFILTVFSPWQWFFSTRPFANNLECLLTVIALSIWPWPCWTLPRWIRQDIRRALQLAALAVVLRPTNVLVWAPLMGCWVLSSYAPYELRSKIVVLVKAGIRVGLEILAIAALLDRAFYGEWAFPWYNFLTINVGKEDIASFYGTNRLHYYVFEALPQLLTTALPFLLIGIYNALVSIPPPPKGFIAPRLNGWFGYPKNFAFATMFVVSIFSLVSHKEMRFLQPLMPILLLLSAKPFAQFALAPKQPWRLMIFALLSASIGIYIGSFHFRGVIDVQNSIRTLYSGDPSIKTVRYLMPCHSTPWRSHLIRPGIVAEALTCEPPLGLTGDARIRYLDEADRFYANPIGFLEAESKQPHDLIVFFGALEPTVGSYLIGKGYQEEMRLWNSHWSPDSRRAGDVVVFKHHKA